MLKQFFDIAVIGGGAAGMAASVFAAMTGASVVLIEKNDRLGHKLSITGKGRCNLTNNCDIETVLRNIPRNARFMHSALNGFSPLDTMAFFEDLGIKLKTERGGRVFPLSDRAADVVKALEEGLLHFGSKILHAKVEGFIVRDGKITGLKTNAGDISCNAAILATGGLSYPKTGSDGGGYTLAKTAGHTVTKLRPSLVPLVSDDSFCAEMQGLSLKNVALKLLNGKDKCIYEDFGEMQFTHYGVSGPIVLSASAHMEKDDRYRLSIDLKPALDEKTLYARITRDFEKYSNKDIKNALDDLSARLMIPVLIKRMQIAPETKTHSVTKEQKLSLLRLLKEFTVNITAMRPIEEAVITSGGIDVTEINPKTMESKLVRGLYFAGEIIDADAYTGGFNLQIAWSTAHSAAAAASR